MRRNRRLRRANDTRTNNRYNRRNRNRFAAISSHLTPTEIDVLAGFTEDLQFGLERFFEDTTEELEFVKDQIFTLDRELSLAENRAKEATAQMAAFEKFTKTVKKLEDFDAVKSISDLGATLVKRVSDATEQVTDLKERLADLNEKQQEIEGDDLFDVLGDTLKDLDTDKSLDGLGKFTTTMSSIISEAGDDFLFDILGGDAREFFVLMEKVGL